MSLRRQRLSLLMPLLGAVLAAAPGCTEEYPQPPIIDPPIEPVDQLVVISAVRPPPISGGTLLVSRDGSRALVADPDRDRLVLVNLTTTDVISEIPLQDGDEPGRVVEDESGRAHVALRRGGAIVSVDLESGTLLARRAACAAPRGMASFAPVEGGEASILVACASGELVELTADPAGAVLESTMIEPDLRDVVITGDGTRAGRKLLVSSFRSAHLITLGPDNQVEGEAQPSGYQNEFSGRSFSPTVAWRTVATPTGAIMMHQRSATVPIEIEPEVPSGYGGDVFDCGGTIVNSATTTFNEQGVAVTGAQRGGVGPQLLPVDIAVAPAEGLFSAGPDDRMVAFVAAGLDTVTLSTLASLEASDGCSDNFVNGTQQLVGPEPIAVGFGPMREDGIDLVVQLREPSMLVILDGASMQQKAQISLGGKPRFDSGHQLFHRNPELQTTISCASCHPEGREDSHTWQFTGIGARRTQSLEGNVMGSAPFHWDGDFNDLGELMFEVFEHRMGGMPQSEQRVEALGSWLENNKRVGHAEAIDSAAVARGKALFEDEQVGCATCHSGASLTNNETMDVGTGKALQVPSLIGVRNRAPYMHDGCAATLHERFDASCGGDLHGDIAGLSESDIDDLVAYMDNL